MRSESKDSDRLPGRFRSWFRRTREKTTAWLRSKKPNLSGKKASGGAPSKSKGFDFDLREVNLKNISRYAHWFRWGLIVLTVFLLAQITAGVIGLTLRPAPSKAPPRFAVTRPPTRPAENFGAIEDRNIFNVEGTIPEPFEAGQLDCMSQARPSGQPIELLGTIVMSDDKFSVALVSLRGNGLRLGVKTNEVFGDGKYQAMKIERKRLCFQVKSSQDFEYVEIPEQGGALSVAGPSFTPSTGGGGIRPVSENQFEVQRAFLDEKLSNLNQILQTARAVPYTDPGSGKFRGFLIQSIDPDSPFAELGLRQGDVLTGVNEILLDNPGKGLEAFQALRGSDAINLRIMRGGRESALQYSVK